MIEITRDTFLTVAGIALVVAILTQVLKRWLRRHEEAWWYDASVISSAFGLALVASLLGWYANREAIDGPVVAFLVLQAVIIGALASGGYEWVKGLAEFVGGAAGAFRAARQEINVNVQTGGVQTGDSTHFEDHVAGDDQ